MRRFRIRHCDGNKNAWLLVVLREDGSESTSHGAYITALSLDGLLAKAGHLAPKPGDRVELVP